MMIAATVPPPTEPVEALPTLPDHLSWSQVSSMRLCPQKFYFSYVAKAPKDFIASSLKFGSAVHAGLEAYFRAAMEGLVADQVALMDAYKKLWQLEDEPGLPIRFNKGEDATTLEHTAGGMFQAFLQHPMATATRNIIGIEESFRSPLVSDLPDIVARVDLVYVQDCTIHLVDFKTCRSRWNAAKVIESADQLRLYAILTSQITGDMPVALHFGVLTKGKNPAFDLLPVPPADSDVTAQEHIASTFRQVHEAMTAGNFYPVPSPQNCTTCPFKSRCPAWSTRPNQG